MKLSSFLTRTVVLAAVLSTVSLRADEAAVAAKLAKIPPAAAEALKKAAGSATIKQVDIEKEGKVTIYEVGLTEAGQPDREVSVFADGKINASEETVPLEKVPAAARKAIEGGAKGAKIERVQRITRKGSEVTYEALYVTKGKKAEVEYLEDGKLKPEEK